MEKKEEKRRLKEEKTGEDVEVVKEPRRKAGRLNCLTNRKRE